MKSFCAVISALLFFGSFSSPACAGLGDEFGLSPYWDWKSMETEHFRITFPNELAGASRRFAQHLEEAHTALAPLLRWAPQTRVQVLVIDNEDQANGLTSAALRFGMILYATPPDTWFSTDYYDDWMRLLVFHEYTHFLNMDATLGVWSIARYLFGDILLPNSLLPTWMLEGLAVYIETRYTRAGRGRSPFYAMVIRSAIESGKINTPDFITFDQLSGPNPYYPVGETAYLFGYHLTFQLTRTPLPQEGATADFKDTLLTQDDRLGILSRRSGERFPYLIDGNLKNVVGKSWKTLWDEWLTEARQTGETELSRIRSQPLSPIEKITGQDNREPFSVESLAPVASPDGKWIAYTRDSADERRGLFLHRLGSTEHRRLFDKSGGVSCAFTPDSKFLLFSALRRRQTYSLWSELGALDVENGKIHWLSSGLRARDPDISPDGKWVVFTIARASSTSVATAPLVRTEDGLSLGDIRVAYESNPYDRASTPKFTKDGKKVLFSLHKNGQPSENLMSLELQSGTALPLVADGKFNQYPTVRRSDGEIFYVSDSTGTWNVFQYRQNDQPLLVSNTTTGIRFPSFDPRDDRAFFASVFTPQGWEVGRVKLLEPHSIDSNRVTLAAPAAPASIPASHSPSVSAEIKDYRPWTTLAPRYWFPLLEISPAEFYLGAGVAGRDAIDIHEYAALAAYSAMTEKFDLSLGYSNRSLGPTLGVSALKRTDGVDLLPTNELLDYTRKSEYSASISFPIQWTHSSLFPSLSIRSEKSDFILPPIGATQKESVENGTYVSSADAFLTYQSSSASRLAVTREEGRLTQLGTRWYFTGLNQPALKGVFYNQENLKITRHSVLSPSIRASWVSRNVSEFDNANVVVQGRRNRVYLPFQDPSLGELPLRGFSNVTFFARSTAIGALDYRFPIAQIHRGWDTWPVFLKNLYGFAFAEAAYFPSREPGQSGLSSVGGGIRSEATLPLPLPTSLVYSIEYHRGFQSSAGGKGEFFFQIGVPGFVF